MGSPVGPKIVVLLTSLFTFTTGSSLRSIREVLEVKDDLPLNNHVQNDPHRGPGAYQMPLSGFSLRALPNMEEFPSPAENETDSGGSMLEAVKFMKKFGYLPGGDNTTGFIFSKSTLTEKLKQVQRFGALPETGELDEATLKLMVSPRCGVADVDSEEGKRRRKRFIIGGPGWNKRNLTYTVANWSPKLTSKSSVQNELRRAFNHWGEYAHLHFTEVGSDDADIIIFFAQYNHYDSYPFDGQGGILAHAYYPYEFESYGGDIHFDESEDWKIKPEDDNSGLDFFTVAVHEIGHSLGLAHSTVQSSIMFPYYKGTERNFAMDYDDIMGLWELYIRRKLDGDDEYFRTSTSETTSTPKTPTTPSYDVAQNDAGEDDVRYHGDYETVDEHEDRKKGDSPNVDLPSLPPLFPDEEDYYEKERRRREEEEKRRHEEERKRQEEERRREEEERKKWEEERRRDEEKRWEEERRIEEERRREWEARTRVTTEAPSTGGVIEDICGGSFDSVALLRDEIFIFKGKYMWRYERKGQLLYGYPAPIRSMFGKLPNWIQGIDAAYERRNDSRIVFFAGKYFYVYDGNELVEGSPRPLTDYGIPEAITKLDAIFYWPKNDKTYLFSRNLYWRRDDFTDTMDESYPRGMERWRGLPNDLDTVITDKEGTLYFFKDSRLWEYNNVEIRPTYDSPSHDLRTWTGC